MSFVILLFNALGTDGSNGFGDEWDEDYTDGDPGLAECYGRHVTSDSRTPSTTFGCCAMSAVGHLSFFILIMGMYFVDIVFSFGYFMFYTMYF
jgi:hypothetical protein